MPSTFSRMMYFGRTISYMDRDAGMSALRGSSSFLDVLLFEYAGLKRG